MKERENGYCLRRRCPVVFRYCCFNRKSWRVWCFTGVLEAMGRGRSDGLVGRRRLEIEGREVRNALRLLSVVVFARKIEVLSEGGPVMREKRESAAAILWWWWRGVEGSGDEGQREGGAAMDDFSGGGRRFVFWPATMGGREREEGGRFAENYGGGSWLGEGGAGGVGRIREIKGQAGVYTRQKRRGREGRGQGCGGFC
ncbi:hypothetical protein HAX54_050552 [Datura stramonium]|uniref:Uncharacterized protein n=1 Tax=Datura stramonium TaxID=4076 RepID=A0ABS8Y6U5_DATST|nr:hypothetical protein [Datura stramonium]